MQAVKVFNNNAVSVVMPDGREAILVGNGLGFGRRPGDVIDKSRVSKVYYVQNELQTKFLKMLDNVTPQVMQAAERISLAAEEQGILLSSKSTISLVDHISFALERVEKGTFLPNLMLSETRMLYPKEYAVGQRALELVRQFCGVQLPEDEAGYIALHLVAGAADGALAKKNKQQAAIIGLMSYFMYLTAGNVTLTQLGMLAEADPLVGLYGTGQSTVFGIQTVDMGVFGGILLGLVCGWVYNRTCEKQFKGIITQIYSGNRWSFTCMVVFSILFGFGSCFFWPPVQNVISALTDLIATSGNFGLFLYGFLERFLIPTGLHHLIYTPFQFSALGNSLTVGDATYTGSYIVMMMEYSMGLPFSDGIVWMYTGFTKTFGYFGIVAAFIFCARKENRKKTAAVLVPLAFTASLASITEPLDFMFCFTAPILWVAHACISGLFIVLLHIFHVTGFTTNLLGSVLMNLSAGADKTNYPTLYLLALCQIAVYFVVFTLLIKAFNLHTPGREEVSTETAGSDAPAKKASVKNAAEVQCVIDGLGGKENILSVDNCFTRLRVNIKDPAKLDEAAINKLPNSGIVKKGTDIQIVYGLQVADIKRAVEAQLENQ